MSRRVLQTSFPGEAHSEMEISVQEIYWGVLLLVRPVGTGSGLGKKQDYHIRRETAIQSHKTCQPILGELCVLTGVSELS